MKDKVREYLKINNIITTKFRVCTTEFKGKTPFNHKCSIYYIHVVGESLGK